MNDSYRNGGMGASGPGGDAHRMRIAPLPTSTPPAASHRTPLALVIDDDPASGELVERTLSAGGIAVRHVQTGEAAMRALLYCRPNVVLLDLSLPDMDGWYVLERIRELSDVPVIVVSGRTSELDKVRALRDGADDY